MAARGRKKGSPKTPGSGRKKGSVNRATAIAGKRRQLAEAEFDRAQLADRVKDLSNRLLNLSQEAAEDEFGSDRVDAALAAMKRAPDSVQAWILQHDHPYRALVGWHATSLN